MERSKAFHPIKAAARDTRTLLDLAEPQRHAHARTGPMPGSAETARTSSSIGTIEPKSIPAKQTQAPNLHRDGTNELTPRPSEPPGQAPIESARTNGRIGTSDPDAWCTETNPANPLFPLSTP